MKLKALKMPHGLMITLWVRVPPRLPKIIEMIKKMTVKELKALIIDMNDDDAVEFVYANELIRSRQEDFIVDSYAKALIIKIPM